jgi:3-methyladenine DNA glycosylase AlkC
MSENTDYDFGLSIFFLTEFYSFSVAHVSLRCLTPTGEEAQFASLFFHFSVRISP